MLFISGTPDEITPLLKHLPPKPLSSHNESQTKDHATFRTTFVCCCPLWEGLNRGVPLYLFVHVAVKRLFTLEGDVLGP